MKEKWKVTKLQNEALNATKERHSSLCSTLLGGAKKFHEKNVVDEQENGQLFKHYFPAELLPLLKVVAQKTPLLAALMNGVKADIDTSEYLLI